MLIFTVSESYSPAVSGRGTAETGDCFSCSVECRLVCADAEEVAARQPGAAVVLLCAMLDCVDLTPAAEH